MFYIRLFRECNFYGLTQFYSVNGFFVGVPEGIGRISRSDVLQNKITVVSIEITRDTRPDGKL